MGKCGRRAYCYLHPHTWVKSDTLFSSHSLYISSLLFLFSSPSLGKPLYPMHSIALHDGCAAWGMGRPRGRGVISGLNSILYQTHLYLHKQEACLLGRESTAIHFLSGCLADEQKLGQSQLWGSLQGGGSDKYVLWFRELWSFGASHKFATLRLTSF